jgi:1-acyl-sn-glycerol-3-phosphate acyltransferase
VARVRLLPAIEPKDFETREDLLRAVREEIAEALPEGMKPLEG